MSTELKENLMDTLRKLVRRQAVIRNWQVAVEQGSIIRRIYPDQATAKEVDDILNSRSQTTSDSSMSGTGYKIWNMPGVVNKKKASHEVAVIDRESKTSMGRLTKPADKVEIKPKSEDIVLNPVKIATMSPAEMQEYAGGFDKLRSYAKSLGIKLGSHGLAKVALLIKQELSKQNVPSSTEEE